MHFIFLVPIFSPVDVRVFHLSGDRGSITVMWQPFTLVEARGFIEYIVQLYLVASDEGKLLKGMEVPMNQDRVTFTGLDTNSEYEVSVGTRSLSGNNETGPGTYI